MVNAACASHSPDPKFVADAKQILLAEATAITRLSQHLDANFDAAVNLILACSGSIIVTGIGKAGLVSQKIAATLASTGTPSQFLHPAEAVHGDLGRIGSRDLLLVLSYSGETEEVIRMLPTARSTCQTIVAITCSAHSTLGRNADVVIALGAVEEAGHLALAPTSSTTAMLALGDALALVVSQQRGFRVEDFARFHPGGNLGLKLATVESLMRPLSECRLATDHLSVRDVIVRVSKPGRRSGAVMLVDAMGKLTGIFTDSDLAKLLERPCDAVLDRPISAVMTKTFVTVASGSKLTNAVSLMSEKKISELPVLGANAQPIGMIDITDVMGLFSTASSIDANWPLKSLPHRREFDRKVNPQDHGGSVRANDDPLMSIPMYRATS